MAKIGKLIPDLNQEISLKDSVVSRWLSKGNIKVIIIFEDQSYKEYKFKLKDEYFFTIAEKKYLIVAKCFLWAGDLPIIMYYYNNPMPIYLKFERTQVNGLNIRTPEEIEKLTDDQKIILAKTHLDSKGLQAVFSSNLLSNFYLESKFTTRSLIIIAIVVCVAILIILQLTGVVDVMGQFNKMVGGLS